MANPFETLGLAPSFALDPAALDLRLRDLNRATHPDRHAGKGAGERRQALNRAMDINHAYRTLRDPASRAEALFELLGAGSSRESTITDPVLLMEMMEQREALEAARNAKDLERLQHIGQSMAARERQVIAALETAFAPLLMNGAAGARQTDGKVARPGAPPEEGGLAEARRLLAELRYVRRFAEEIAAFEDES
ncbi:MAG: Fe-S protein assembly co-chaperone HscB [Deltaproteobacteria bacterium]